LSPGYPAIGLYKILYFWHSQYSKIFIYFLIYNINVFESSLKHTII
jgi:hypothetical protein